MRIVPAHDAPFIPTVRALFEEYAADSRLDLCFQGFPQELASLPGQYAPPDGTLLLAQCDGHPAGCVAQRKIAEGVCEMKRLYVRPGFRAHGVGWALAVAIMAAAQKAGHRAMRLDTLASMKPAITLYESLGFQRTEPYYNNPLPEVLYFERPL